MDIEGMKPALLWEKLDGGSVRCDLCAFHCVIKDGQDGICRVRTNTGGELFTRSWGRSTPLAVDPIEKKPLYHFKPGARVLSFGTPGCNFSCTGCQNSHLSQWMKTGGTDPTGGDIKSPAMIARAAISSACDGIAYTYSEPTIFFEYTRDVILECRRNPATDQLFHVFVSNGYFSGGLLDMIARENLIQAINIDLKFMDNAHYRHTCGASLQPVLDSIKFIAGHNENIMLELTNLVIAGENDNAGDLRRLSDFVASISVDIPLHFSRFFPQYKMSHLSPTPAEKLLEAREIALAAGLHYVYIGNTNIIDAENTYCPNCNNLLIERARYAAGRINIDQNDNAHPKCPSCQFEINIKL